MLQLILNRTVLFDVHWGNGGPLNSTFSLFLTYNLICASCGHDFFLLTQRARLDGRLRYLEHVRHANKKIF